MTRVIIKVGTLYFCECFTSDEELTATVDAWMAKYDLCDGCSGFTPEDYVAANAWFAEHYDDIYNTEHFVQCDENFEDTLNAAISDYVEQWGLDEEAERTYMREISDGVDEDEATLHYAKNLGIDIASLI